jgi:hypothetical protein
VPTLRPVDIMLRIEWFVVAGVAILGYSLAGGSWQQFLLLILVPDIAMLGYLAGPRVGAIAYNAAHLVIWPAILVIAGFLLPQQLALQVGLIWLAHIAIDRALGYGLKLPTGFQDTHLGRIGGGPLS